VGFAEIVGGIIKANDALLRQLVAVVDKYLDQSGRRWVELDGLFSFMKM
jgi:DNA polymerase alpha subunit A